MSLPLLYITSVLDRAAGLGDPGDSEWVSLMRNVEATLWGWLRASMTYETFSKRL